jgi:hypothetical protein
MRRTAPHILNRPVFFCSAACIPANDSFTMALHPDVGEGAGPQPVRPGRAFYLREVGNTGAAARMSPR